MKNKLKLIFALIAVSMVFSASAQFETRKLYYTLERTSPTEMKSLSFSVTPLSIDLYDPNYSLGIQLGAEYHIKNILIIGARLNRAYADRGKENYNPSMESAQGTSIYKSQPYTNLDVYGQFLFNSKIKQVKQLVSLETKDNVDYATKIPLKRLETYSIRFGYNTNYFWANSDGGATYRLNGYKINFDDKYIEKLEGGTMIKNDALTFGSSRIRKYDLKVKLNQGYGYREISYKTEIYFDVIYAFSQKLQNMVVTKEYEFDDNGNLVDFGGTNFKTLNMEYNVDDNTTKTPYGFRVGYRYTDLKKFGWCYGIETGFRPGPGEMIYNWYLAINIGMSFGVGI